MEQTQPQNIENSKNISKSKVPLIIVVILFVLTALIIGGSVGFLIGRGDLEEQYTPQIVSSTAPISKSISGTISQISGNMITVNNVVMSLDTPLTQDTNSGVFDIELTSNTEITKIAGAIESGQKEPNTVEISVGELSVGMIVKIESVDPITSSKIIAKSIEAQAGVAAQQNDTSEGYRPPPAPINLNQPSQSSASGSEE